MKKNAIKNMLSIAFVAILALAATTACKKQVVVAPSAEDYAENISNKAEEINKECPREVENGKTLLSVTFDDNTLLYRLSVTDEEHEYVKKNFNATRDSLTRCTTDNLKEQLIAGKCSMEYRYIAPNDSTPITITPEELEKSDSEGDDDNDDDE